MSRNQRLSFLGIAAVIAVVAIVVLTTGGSDDTTTDDSTNTSAQQTATPSATPTAAESDDATPTPTPKPKPQAPLLVAGKVAKLRYEEGETVRFRVRNDGPEHVHVHGYDIMKDIEPGKTANVSFKADITGIFEIEFEDSAQQIAELRVDPK
jgi:type V secretory pathway adhesin AidA